MISILIVLGTFVVRKRKFVRLILLLNFIIITILYGGMFYADHDGTFIVLKISEASYETLRKFSLDTVYKLYYHIFAILIFAGLNILVLLKHYPTLKNKGE